MAGKIQLRWHGWLVLLASVAAAFAASSLPVGRFVDLWAYDLLMSVTGRPPTASYEVAVVGVEDDGSISDPQLRREIADVPQGGRRRYLAGVLDGLLDAGAVGIGLDIVLSGPVPNTCDREADQSLKTAFKKAAILGRPVVIGFYPGRGGRKTELPHDYFLFSVDRLAFLNFDEEADERKRSLPLSLGGRDEEGHNAIVRALSFELAALAKKDISPEASSHLKIDFRLAPLPRHSFWDIYSLAAANTEEARAKLREAFSGRLVFIGYTFGTEDEHNIPFPVRSGAFPGKDGLSDRMHGICLHALATKTLLSGPLLKDVPPWVAQFPALGLALASALLFMFLPPLRAGALAALLAGLACLAVYKLFSAFLVIPAAPLFFGLIIPGTAAGTYRSAVQYRQFRFVRRFFRSYVNPHVLQQIIDDPKSVYFEGQRVTVSVMFADIRNYSTLSEDLDPQHVVAGLNRYLAEMTEAVVKVDGYMNRFLGDGFLAIFGAPNRLPDEGAMNAVECGLEMLERLRRLNESGIFPGVREVRIGIGVHTGEAIVGNIGCHQKMDYTITGDTPNLASRIEGMTKVYGTPFLISETTYERVKDRVEARFVDSTLVKGRKGAVNLYEVIALKGK